MTGPYNTPLTLARRPLAALFWSMLAPTVFLYGLMLPLDVVTLGWAGRQFGEGGSLGGRWQVLVIVNFLMLAAMSWWAERVGAGPFAGRMRTDTDWLAIGAVTGPVVLLGSLALVGALVGDGTGDWVYRRDADTSLLTRAALGPSMIVYAVLLAPLAEELAFRGIALGCLIARGWSPVAAAVLTSAGFAVIHLQYTPAAMVPVFITGLYLAWLRVHSGSMAVPIAAHISANAVSMAVFAVFGG